jgi:hypothetical protein
MTHAKKNPAGAGEVSKKGKADPTGNGKVIPFRAKAGKFGEQKQRQKEQRETRKWSPKKILDQIEIPFPRQGGDGVEGTGDVLIDTGRCKEGCPFGAWMGTCHAADCKNQKGKEGTAAQDQQPDQTVESPEGHINRFLNGM